MARPLIVLAGCDDALYLVELGASADEDQLAGRQPGAAVERSRPLQLVPPWAAAHLVDVDAVGSTLVLALERRPPLMVSHDAGQTWVERGAGLPPPRAVAVRENPDHCSSAAATVSTCPATAGSSGAPSASSCQRSATSPGASARARSS